ncbi:hypothetical protein N3K63_01450 [Microbacterium sp. W1N]|uniref:hypothetical protein n=1 Tax=Microbacterium festucae TaxID=2977531 RepID=UPI0021BE78C9|nr:hypothetical protein [Microbacterium festucae]MCT9818944.1 hypothetical protein [Microbacterium festucae]
MRRTATATALILVALGLSACATGAPMPDPTSATPAPSASTRPPLATTTPGVIAPTGTPAEVPPARWSAIEDDLAGRGVTAAPVLVSAENVTFNDGSLGCAAPGQSYTQAQIDGMRVVVEADGTTYDYRFGNGDTPQLCTR